MGTYVHRSAGVQVAQEIDGQVTEWVLDTIGLAQVLLETSGGTTVAYVYGLGRLSQIEGTDAEWFLGNEGYGVSCASFRMAACV